VEPLPFAGVLPGADGQHHQAEQAVQQVGVHIHRTDP
jgi:hypothetical protein